uniref:Uncharacterized protein n=1 Tax=Canis lupus familiaris TaxID=9615 RepID=A0A8C0RSW1_CANLF
MRDAAAAAAAAAGLWLLALGSLLALRGGLPAPRSPPPADRLPRRPGPAPRPPPAPAPARDARGGSPKTFRALLTLAAGAGGGGAARGPPGGREGRAAVRGGVFWSRGLEERVPRGFSEAQAAAWLEAARGARVVALERGGCGRSSNRLARFADGTRACVRYGVSPEQIQGEALSFYLARLLGPPAPRAAAGPGPRGGSRRAVGAGAGRAPRRALGGGQRGEPDALAAQPHGRGGARALALRGRPAAAAAGRRGRAGQPQPGGAGGPGAVDRPDPFRLPDGQLRPAGQQPLQPAVGPARHAARHQQPAPRPRRGAGLSGQRGGPGARLPGGGHVGQVQRAAAAVGVRVPRADGAARAGAAPRPGRGRAAAAPLPAPRASLPGAGRARRPPRAAAAAPPRLPRQAHFALQGQVRPPPRDLASPPPAVPPHPGGEGERPPGPGEAGRAARSGKGRRPGHRPTPSPWLRAARRLKLLLGCTHLPCPLLSISCRLLSKFAEDGVSGARSGTFPRPSLREDAALWPHRVWIRRHPPPPEECAPPPPPPPRPGWPAVSVGDASHPLPLPHPHPHSLSEKGKLLLEPLS